MVGTALLILSIAGGNKDDDEDFRSNLIYASTLDLASPDPRSETQLEKRSHMKSFYQSSQRAHSALNGTTLRCLPHAILTAEKQTAYHLYKLLSSKIPRPPGFTRYHDTTEACKRLLG